MVATVYCAFGADAFRFIGVVINTTEPDKPVAAPIRFVFDRDRSCTLTISPPLSGSGACTIRTYDKQAGRFEIDSTGGVNISWMAVVKGNYGSGSFTVETPKQSGIFYFAVIPQDEGKPKPKP
jgi:hypothetical protein